MSYLYLFLFCTILHKLIYFAKNKRPRPANVGFSFCTLPLICIILTPMLRDGSWRCRQRKHQWRAWEGCSSRSLGQIISPCHWRHIRILFLCDVNGPCRFVSSVYGNGIVNYSQPAAIEAVSETRTSRKWVHYQSMHARYSEKNSY